MKEPPVSKISCPHCGKEVEYRAVRDIPTFPFCSERCKLTDLGLWLEEEHRISSPLSARDREDHASGIEREG